MQMTSEKKNNPISGSPSKSSDIQRFIKVMSGRWVVVFGFVIILILIIVAIFAPWIAPYGENAQDMTQTLAQPSLSHWLGTDEVGRDVLSRVIYGSRISLLVGLVATTIAGVIGMSLGLLAGYFGGWVNTIIMRCIDALLALPPLILMLAISSILGSGILNVLIALGIGMMPTYCRLMCGQVITVRERDFILVSRGMGSGHMRIMLRHVLPNTFPPMLVLVTINLGAAIMMEASLSFLGIGILPPTASWGAMVTQGYRFMLTNPLVSFTPGLAILLVVLAFNMLGDGLRDALDPRLRGLI
jgi:peptide/nickel transport system permease protein